MLRSRDLEEEEGKKLDASDPKCDIEFEGKS